MPRIKKKVDASVSGPPPPNLSESLTAGRSRRTIKPNPKYLNDEMVVPPSKDEEDSFEGSEMSEGDFEMDEDDLDHLIVRKSVAPSSTPQMGGSVPKRRGRPPKNPDAPRTEPVKNLRKEMMKKMDVKTISISKSRHIMAQMMRDGRRKLEMSIDSVESDSADMEEEKLDQSTDDADDMRQSQQGNTTVFKKHLGGKTILERRGSGATKSSVGIKVAAGTTEDDEDDEFYNDSDAKTSQAEQVVPAKRPVGRPRKHPAKQQTSLYNRRVLLPGMKNASFAGQTLKRKAAATDSNYESKRESQQSKMLRRSYGLKHVNSSQNQSQDTDTDDNEDGEQSEFSMLPRGAGRVSKNSYYMMNKKKQKLLEESRKGRLGDQSPTITYVSVKDIMKKSKSSSDNRRTTEQEEDSDEASEIEEENVGENDDSARRNNQLVATILERKRPIAIENLQDVRRRVRQSELLSRKKKDPSDKQQQRVRDLGVSEILTEDDIVDFEDMLQKNIVSANKSSRVPPEQVVARGRGRPSENFHPNAKTNMYKSVRVQQRQSAGAVMGLKRSSQPPRILNATMKLGEGRALSKLSATSGNNHYSIDLADPDNNVKLISSPENSPNKRQTAGAVNAGGNVVRVLGNTRPEMVRDNQRLSGGSEFRKKKITCFERWYVVNCRFADTGPKKQSFALSMIELGNIAASIKLPSDEWSLRTVLEKRKTPPAEGDEVFTGDVQDDMIAEDEKSNYEPHRIMFRRKAHTPGRFNVQYDRTIIFRSDCYSINIDGQACRLLASPVVLESVEDIEVLLSIVDHIDLKNGCVELIPPIRGAPDSIAKRTPMGGKAVAV